METDANQLIVHVYIWLTNAKLYTAVLQPSTRGAFAGWVVGASHMQQQQGQTSICALFAFSAKYNLLQLCNIHCLL